MTKKEIVNLILIELQNAEVKHPEWNYDINKMALIMLEEAGEVAKAILKYQDEKGSFYDIKNELIQTAAMCIRILNNIGFLQFCDECGIDLNKKPIVFAIGKRFCTNCIKKLDLNLTIK